MNDQMQDLARRAVACKHWRWMPGMRAFEGSERFRVFEVLHGYPSGVNEQNAFKNHIDLGLNWMPDLTDPATLGCLLALVREAWGSPMLNTVQERGVGWIVADSLCCSMLANRRYYRGQTEAEALVAALEAAP